METRSQKREIGALLRRALDRVLPPGHPETEGTRASVARAIDVAAAQHMEEVAVVGTGYGRQTLPFAKESVRSEILCHGRGAHRVFPGTRTVLDIGGQDTKAIQVDGHGVVTSFQMNDRCAAGCGRYLGYIADELNLGLHELGPLALQSTKSVKVCSTCTVFAGAELRERLALGQKREDILAGLHRAIMLRAMSLLARSGGVANEFTFTGGVCNNGMAVKVLRQLVARELRPGHDAQHPPRLHLHGRPRRGALRSGRRACGTRGAAARVPARRRSGGAIMSGSNLTAGIDCGSSSVKVAVTRSAAGADGEILATSVQRIRRRNVHDVAQAAFAEACTSAGVDPSRFDYVASTGDADAVTFATGHFYGMTTHARGGVFLFPQARAALDMGALHARAIKMDERGKVLGHRMTSQCASGSGQFLENIARYLGVPLDDVGTLSHPGQECRGGVEHLRGARRDRRHQHGQPRPDRRRHPQGHPPEHRGAPRATASLGGGGRGRRLDRRPRGGRRAWWRASASWSRRSRRAPRRRSSATSRCAPTKSRSSPAPSVPLCWAPTGTISS